MATRFADAVNQGVAAAETLAAEARTAVVERSSELDARIAHVMHRARRGLEQAGDVCDETRLAIRRHPFYAAALMFGAGALVGLVVGRLIRTSPAPATLARHPLDDDIEC